MILIFIRMTVRDMQIVILNLSRHSGIRLGRDSESVRFWLSSEWRLRGGYRFWLSSEPVLNLIQEWRLRGWFCPPAGGFVRMTTAAPSFRTWSEIGVNVKNADSDFRQNDVYGTVTGIILSTSWRIRQDDDSRAVILNLIQNLCYCQKTQILTFVRMTVTISVIPDLIRNRFKEWFWLSSEWHFRQSLSWI